jgi:hypothetical protein
MLSRLLLLLPDASQPWPWWVFLLTLLAGLAVWVAGARFSRALIVLAAVTLGAVIGKVAPQALGIRFDPMACVVAGALAFAIAAFLLHRLILASALGGLAFLWTASAVWALADKPKGFHWPTLHSAGELGSFLQGLHAQLGTDLIQQIASLAVLASISFVSLSILFPRAATTFFWSLVGVTMVVSAGVSWCHYLAPERLSLLPQSAATQGILLGSAVLAGWAAQAILAARKSAQSANSQQQDPAPPAQAIAA